MEIMQNKFKIMLFNVFRYSLLLFFFQLWYNILHRKTETDLYPAVNCRQSTFDLLPIGILSTIKFLAIPMFSTLCMLFIAAKFISKFVFPITASNASPVSYFHPNLFPLAHWQKKWTHFDLKNWVTGGNKIRPGIPSNWRTFESKPENQFQNWLSISSQFDSNILQLLVIPGRILVPPVTQLFILKWPLFSFSV